MVSSASLLTGKLLDGGWRVISPVTKGLGETGGVFSYCYIVENRNGSCAFLKALDYSIAFAGDDPASILQAMTAAFIFERDILNKCKNERLDRVVTAITDGTIKIDGQTDGGVVQYLIFEVADGDIRRQANISKKFDVAWSLRSLHHISTGLKQIHYHDIAHQDLKPSNVLIYNEQGSKITDFGRASHRGHDSPFDNEQVAGDLTYAPPEQLYGYDNPNWKIRRFGCDAYLLGSMAVFFFTGTGTTPLIFAELPDEFHFSKWRGTYEEALPYLKLAFSRVLDNYKQSLPDTLQRPLLNIVSQLCEPDPKLRGDPKELTGPNQFSMERYISWFNRLARHAELGILDQLKK